MTVNADIKRKENENGIGFIRRFSRQIKEIGILRKIRSIRYYERSNSSFKEKHTALRRLKKQAEYRRKEKMGLLINIDKKKRR